MNLKGKFSKFLGCVTAAVMGLTMLPQVSPTSFNSSAASPGDRLSVGNGTNQHKGVSDGYSYEIWIDTTGGSGTMTLGQGGAFKAEWSASVPSGNFLARRGKDYGSTTKATQCGDIVLNYEADYRQTGSANGNSRLCVYGWFENQGAAGNVPLVEYYIIEDWVDWVPDAAGKMVTIDGAQYKVFQMDHTGPTIHGRTETFKQYFSVRQSKRKSGTITVSDHFKVWEQQGWGIGNLYEVALNAEGWQSSGVADVTKLTFGGGSPVPTEPTQPKDPEKPADGTNYFNDTFESSTGGWESRGGATVAASSANAYSGNKSLSVSGRTENWHGAAISLDPDQFVPGHSYSFSTAFLQNSGSSDTAKITLQYNDGGTESYATVAEATAKSGEWTKLENTSFEIPAGATDLLLYVEAESTTDFFIDNTVGAVEGTKSSVVTGGGDVSQTPTQGQTPTNPSQTPSYSSDSYIGKFGHLFKMGTSVSPRELSNSTGASFIKKHFNSITPENELKPDSILKQGSTDNTRCNVSLASAAQTLKFCEDNNIGVRGHTFVWYSQTPDWFFRENFSTSGNYVSKDIMNKRLENFIKDTFDLLAKEYPNLNVYAYDVCNELFVNDGGGLRPGSNSGWTKVYGDTNDEFIINAFTYARKYAPAGCKLYINDYNEYIPAKTNDIYNIAMKLKELGVIDGIGMQSHLDVGYPSAQVYKTGLEKFLSTGLEVSITELDITESSKNSQAQADLYKAIFELAVEHADQIPSFTLWGTHDDISWRGSQTPLPFGSGYTPKKAFDAIMSIDVPSPSQTTTSKTTEKPNTTTPTTPAQPTGLAGDVNCDGKVTIADAAALLQNLANGDKYKLTDEGRVNGDVDGNAGLTASDALEIQKYDAGLVSKLTLTGGSSTTQKKTDVVTTKATTPAAQTYFDSNFNSSASGWTGRGDASVEISSDSYYSGKSLFVSGRSDYWHGAATELGSDFKAGNTYSFSGAVMQQSGSATTMQLTLQYTLNGEENYDQIASATVKSGEWTKLENTAYTIPSGATNMLIYVEAPDSYTDFYIDEFVGATEGTKSSVTTGGGMVGKAPVTTTPTTPPTGNFPDPTKPMMAISFDDGTDPNGKKIIDALAKEGFTATFFYVGNWIKDESQVKYAYQKGMEVANHTTTHPYLTNLSASEIKNEYNQTYTKLKNIIGAEPSKLLRLPYLASNSTVTSALSDVPMITCAIDTEDWNGASKDQIVSKIKNAMNNGSANGSIILCHETYASTAAAMEEIAPYAKAQGWQIVSISEMFAAKGKTLNGGQIYQKCN